MRIVRICLRVREARTCVLQRLEGADHQPEPMSNTSASATCTTTKMFRARCRLTCSGSKCSSTRAQRKLLRACVLHGTTGIAPNSRPANKEKHPA